MCLYPRFIKNKRYTGYTLKAPAKGNSTTKECNDYRKLYVPIGCGKCYECKRQKAQQWRVRLHEELKVNKYAYFVTLTFSNEEFAKLCKDAQTTEDNAIATFATRRFLERYRKKHGKSLRHWLITELGHENTERIHLHGIIFPTEEMTLNELQTLWKYGRADNGQYVNRQTINYIVKYVTKIDTDHKNFEAVILCSAGLGANFVKTYAAKTTYKYAKGKTPEHYTLPDGNKVALPIYYRNKLFTQEERDNMWTDRLDKATIYVNGIKIENTDTEAGQEIYLQTLEEQQRINKILGYGDATQEWKKLPYHNTWKGLQHRTN